MKVVGRKDGQSALPGRDSYAQAAAFAGAISRQLFAYLESRAGPTIPSMLRSVAKYPNRLFEEHEFYESCDQKGAYEKAAEAHPAVVAHHSPMRHLIAPLNDSNCAAKIPGSRETNSKEIVQRPEDQGDIPAPQEADRKSVV